MKATKINVAQDVAVQEVLYWNLIEILQFHRQFISIQRVLPNDLQIAHRIHFPSILRDLVYAFREIPTRFVVQTEAPVPKKSVSSVQMEQFKTNAAARTDQSSSDAKAGLQCDGRSFIDGMTKARRQRGDGIGKDLCILRGARDGGIGKAVVDEVGVNIDIESSHQAY